MVGTWTSMREDTDTASSSRVPRFMDEKEAVLSWRFMWNPSWTDSALRRDFFLATEGLVGAKKEDVSLYYREEEMRQTYKVSSFDGNSLPLDR